MDRRTFLNNQTVAVGIGLTGLALTAGCSEAGKPVPAQSGQPGVMIAIPLVKKPGSTDEDLVAQVRVFADYVSKAAGFLEGTLLKPASGEMTFDYLEVTRWKSQQDWENLYNSPNFLALVRDNAAFTVRLASVFVPAPL